MLLKTSPTDTASHCSSAVARTVTLTCSQWPHPTGTESVENSDRISEVEQGRVTLTTRRDKPVHACKLNGALLRAMHCRVHNPERVMQATSHRDATAAMKDTLPGTSQTIFIPDPKNSSHPSVWQIYKHGNWPEWRLIHWGSSVGFWIYTWVSIF